MPDIGIQQIFDGPVMIRPTGNTKLLAVAYKKQADSNGVSVEYWALLEGKKLNPGTSSWTGREFKTPNSNPDGAPDPTPSQFQSWAEDLMTQSHGSLPNLDYYTVEETEGI